MAKYRKKPVIVEAEQFIIWDTKKPPQFVTIHGVTFPVYDLTIIIPTLEGQHVASNLDWIIKGVKGELYPCKPDIFDATYEESFEHLWDNTSTSNVIVGTTYTLHNYVKTTETETKCAVCGLESWQHYKLG
jgi:hypothetical protein